MTPNALYRFVESASKGTWWTNLAPSPAEPSWGTDKIHVYIAPLLSGTLYAISDKPKLNSQELSIGADAGEIQRVVKLLEEHNDSGRDNGP